MINITPELLEQLKSAGLEGVNPLAVKPPVAATAATSPLAVKTAAPTANPLAVKATTPTATAAPIDMAAATRAAINGVVGPYQAQTPEEQAYAAELAKYVGGLDAQYGKYGSTQLYGQRMAQLPFGGPSINYAPTADEISAYYGKTPEQNTFYSFNLESNKGNPTGQVNVGYNTPIVLYDYANDKVVYSGTGFDAAEKVAEMAAGLTSEGGRKAEWGIFTGAPGSTDPSTFKQVAYEKPNQSTLGVVADFALPAIGGIFGPLGAAAGSALSSVAQGRSFEDTLLRAGISGLASYGMGKLTTPGFDAAGAQAAANAGLENFAANGFTFGAGQAAGQAAGQVAGGLAQGAAQGALQGGVQEIGNEILITAAKKAVEQGLSPTIQAAISSGIASSLADLVAPDFAGEQAYQSGAVKEVPTPASIGADEIPVTASWRPQVTNAWRPENVIDRVVTGGLSGAAANATPNQTPQADPDAPPAEEPIEQTPATDEEIRVVARKAVDMGLADSVDIAIQNGMAQALIDKFGPDIYAEEPSSGSKWSNYLKYGALGLKGLDILNNALGGGGGSSGSGGTGTLTRNPIFSAKLPEPSAGFGGSSGSSFAARPVSTYGGTGQGGGMTMNDWLSYGTRPERSFFEYVPENTATIAPPVTPSTGTGGGGSGGGDNNGPRPRRRGRRNRSEEGDQQETRRTGRGPRVRNGMIVEKAMGGYAAGGRRKSFAVEGQGTGRSDEIPAVLSDGEYVIDAETVALLGDGSSKAGAKKLDEFRVNVRKHKGAKLAKGRFSANAKSPEKYLAGGKA